MYVAHRDVRNHLRSLGGAMTINWEDLKGAERDLADTKRSLELARADVRMWERREVEDMVKLDDLRKKMEAAGYEL
jgi:hypothetical protein